PVVSTIFDHRVDGTLEQAWKTSGLDRLPSLDPLSADASVLVVAAHPDDETLGAGGLMADAAAGGAAVHVLVATDGEASHPQSPTRSARQLATVRRAEAVEAVAVVAPGAKVEFLGLPDGRLAAHRDELVAAIGERLPGRTLVLSPWLGDRHPDHEVCAEAVREATMGRIDIRHWQYPIWAWHWGQPSAAGQSDRQLPWSRLHRIELTETAVSTKQLALQCHVSQHSPLSSATGDEAILPPHMLAHFTRDFETFVLDPVQGPWATTRPGYFDAPHAAADDPWGPAELRPIASHRERDVLLGVCPIGDTSVARTEGIVP
ncbi:MAG: PIG-L family deacetylase, partial [Jatrophihabitantaceae bacterium]